MGGLKRFLLSFFKTRDIHPDFVYFYTILNFGTLVGLAGHFIFFFIFWIINIPFLSFLNIGSMLLYIFGFIMNQHKKHFLSQAVCSLEVLIHAFLAVTFLGWESGFHYYIICIIPIAFFASKQSPKLKFSITGIYGLSYIALFVYSFLIKPLNPPDIHLAHGLNIMNMTGSAAIIAFISFYYSRTVVRAEERMRLLNRNLELLAKIDHLTGLYNRRFMLEKIDDEVKRSKRSMRPFSLVICDIDDFKIFNDSYGHDCGDYILKSLSDFMKKSLRDQDSLARWGGEEFMILLAETSLENAAAIADRMRAKIAETKYVYKRMKYKLTMTFGLAVFDGSAGIEECVIKADQALLTGKRQGKNRVNY